MPSNGMKLFFSSFRKTTDAKANRVGLKKYIPGILGRFFLISGANGVTQALGIIYSLLLARWLLPEGYGILAGCYAAASISSYMLNWGMDTWLVRQASTDPEPLRLAGTVLKRKGLIGIVWVSSLWIILTRLSPDFYLTNVLALVLIDAWLEAGITTVTSLFYAVHRTRTVSVLLVANRSLRLASAVALILLERTGILPFVSVRLAFTALVLITSIVLARPNWSGPTRIINKKMWIQLMPFASSDMLAGIYSQMDVFLLSLLAGKTATGIYAPAVSLINALITLEITAFWLFIPYLTQTYKKQPDKLKIQLFQILALIGFVGFGIMIILGGAGPRIVDLVLSRSYHESGALLRILSPIMFLKSLSVGCAAFLVATERQHKRLLPQLASAATNLTLNLWAIPLWGVTGAAMVYLASEAVLLVGYATNVILFFTSKKKLHESST
jgi:O-antigen/teichoic acid export membrane protein